MKTFLCLLTLAGLFATAGCTVEEHGYRGGYYDHDEYHHGYYHHDRDHDHDGYWDRGRYYYYY